MATDTFTSDQGVYAIVVLLRHDGKLVYRIYIGSGFGIAGLKHRIYNNHFSDAYRLKEPSKYLYKCMAKPGAVSKAVCLVRFRQKVDMVIPIVAEAVMTSIFGGYNHPVYRESHQPSLPVVDWKLGCNNADPLASGERMWEDAAKAKQRNKLENAQAGGPIHLSYKEARGSIPEGWFVRIFDQIHLQIERSVALSLDLPPNHDADNTVNVRYDIADGKHPNAWVRNASDKCDGRRLGIQVSRMVNGQEVKHWIHSRYGGLKFEAKASSLFDWLTDAIDLEDADTRDWGHDRIALWGLQSQQGKKRAARGDYDGKDQTLPAAPIPAAKAAAPPTALGKRKQVAVPQGLQGKKRQATLAFGPKAPLATPAPRKLKAITADTDLDDLRIRYEDEETTDEEEEMVVARGSTRMPIEVSSSEEGPVVALGHKRSQPEAYVVPDSDDNSENEDLSKKVEKEEDEDEDDFVVKRRRVGPSKLFL